MKHIISAISIAAAIFTAAGGVDILRCTENDIRWLYEIRGRTAVIVSAAPISEGDDMASDEPGKDAPNPPETLAIPAKLDETPIVAIAENAFAGCTSLVAITIPRNITNIAARAFAGCSALSSIIFLGAEPTIGEGAFDGIGTNAVFRAPSAEKWSVAIPGEWLGHPIADLSIGTYRRKILIYLPSIVGVVGTLSVLVLAIILRERRKDDEDDDF